MKYKLKTEFTSEMIQDLRAHGIDITEKLQHDIERELVYKKRKRIIEKILNENTTNDNK